MSDIHENTDWLQPGRLVDYHAVIGGEVTKANCRVRVAPFIAPSGTWCCRVEGVRGWIACAAVTPSPDRFDEGLALIASKMRGEHGHQALFNAGAAAFVLRARDYIKALEDALDRRTT